MRHYREIDANVADCAINIELEKAIEKHPVWDNYTAVEMGLILTEECGEVVHAVNDMLELQNNPHYDPEELLDMLRKFFVEAAQVGAVSKRILMEYSKRGTTL
jgi:NTP pyrophosphatase (non-canonical NTP hydrolase)